MVYKDGWWTQRRQYVTIDGIDRQYMRDACMAFDIYPYNIDSFYDSAIDDNDLVYDYNHKELYHNEEEDDE